MKELVEVIAKALVDNPDEVVVTESENDDETVIELKVAPSDMGKGHRQAGKDRKGHPFRCKGRCFQTKKRRLWLRFSNFRKDWGSDET